MSESIEIPSETPSQKRQELSDEEYQAFLKYQQRASKMADLRAKRKQKKAVENPEVSTPKIPVPRPTITRAMSSDEKLECLKNAYQNNDSASSNAKVFYNKIKGEGKGGRGLISMNDCKKFLITQQKQSLMDRTMIPPSFNRHVSKAIDTSMSNHLASFEERFKGIIDDFKTQFKPQQAIPHPQPQEIPQAIPQVSQQEIPVEVPQVPNEVPQQAIPQPQQAIPQQGIRRSSEFFDRRQVNIRRNGFRFR